MKYTSVSLFLVLQLLSACQASSPPIPFATTDRVDEVEPGDSKLSCDRVLDQIQYVKDLLAQSRQNISAIRLSRENYRSTRPGGNLFENSDIPGLSESAVDKANRIKRSGDVEDYEIENSARMERRKTLLTDMYNKRC